MFGCLPIYLSATVAVTSKINSIMSVMCVRCCCCCLFYLNSGFTYVYYSFFSKEQQWANVKCEFKFFTFAHVNVQNKRWNYKRRVHSYSFMQGISFGPFFTSFKLWSQLCSIDIKQNTSDMHVCMLFLLSFLFLLHRQRRRNHTNLLMFTELLKRKLQFELYACECGTTFTFSVTLWHIL